MCTTLEIAWSNKTFRAKTNAGELFIYYLFINQCFMKCCALWKDFRKGPPRTILNITVNKLASVLRPIYYICRAGRWRRYEEDMRTLNEFAVAWPHGDALLFFFSGFLALR